MKSPCMNCPDRFPACHDTCAKFYAWKSWDKLRKTKPEDGGADGFRTENRIKRHKKYMRFSEGKVR